MAVPHAATPGTPTGVAEPTPVLRAGDELAGRLTRTEVQRGPSSIPGRELVQVLTELPRGADSGWHTHPGEEVGYLIGGTVELSVEGRPTRTVHAGEGFLVPPRTPHNARDLGPGSGRVLSTHLVETGQPLATLTRERRLPARRAGRAGTG
jgi:quercetin dioxygenase-like cupin family protein